MSLLVAGYEKHGRRWNLTLHDGPVLLLSGWMEEGASRSAEWDVDAGNLLGLDHPYDTWACDALQDFVQDTDGWVRQVDGMDALLDLINDAIPPVWEDVHPPLEGLAVLS